MLSICNASLITSSIENIFNQIREKVTEDSIVHQVQPENFEEFSIEEIAHVKRTFEEFPVEEIDKTIDSMQKRMKLITSSCGKRIKH